MQYIIILAVIVVIMIILGVSTQLIANISAWMILLACALLCFMMCIFFMVFLARLLCAKKTSGYFAGAKKKDKARFDTAYYIVGESEIKNIFPYESSLKSLFYKEGREVTLRLSKDGKRVFDLNARVTIISGFLLSVIMTGVLINTAIMLYAA